jgi:prepilin-type N-terminal cleavage/methylation domain-containing protein
MRRAFTLIEVLVVIAIVALLVSLALPALASARESSRQVVCQSNLRSVYTIIRAYADTHKGFSPALGQPYAAPPNWALVVQQSAGLAGASGSELYAAGSVLSCPTSRSLYQLPMTRCYAINATGHAGQPGDPDNFDTAARPAFLRLDLADRPWERPLMVDSQQTPSQADQPPSTRTWSVLDFRQEAHRTGRLAVLHAKGTRFSVVYLDGHAGTRGDVPDLWHEPLP